MQLVKLESVLPVDSVTEDIECTLLGPALKILVDSINFVSLNTQEEVCRGITDLCVCLCHEVCEAHCVLALEGVQYTVEYWTYNR